MRTGSQDQGGKWQLLSTLYLSRIVPGIALGSRELWSPRWLSNSRLLGMEIINWVEIPVLKTKATALVGLGKRQFTLWLLLQKSRKITIALLPGLWDSTVPPSGKTGLVFLIAEQKLGVDCVCEELEFTFLETHWESSKGQRKQLK